MADLAVAPFGWERTALAVEKVKDRLRRATKALAQSGVPYAVVGGNAVAEWVGRVEEAAVRNTRDVDILIRRQTSIPLERRWKRPGSCIALSSISTHFSTAPAVDPKTRSTCSSLAKKFDQTT